MKNALKIFLLTFIFIFIPISSSGVAHAQSVPCTPAKSILGIPTWYEYLPGNGKIGDKCVPQIGCSATTQTCDNQSKSVDLAQIWLIGLAIIDILLRLTGFITVGMVIFGGFKYITSQGNPDATKSARKTIINAFAGLAITIVASVSVNFIAQLIK